MPIQTSNVTFRAPDMRSFDAKNKGTIAFALAGLVLLSVCAVCAWRAVAERSWSQFWTCKRIISRAADAYEKALYMAVASACLGVAAIGSLIGASVSYRHKKILR